jgi:hypothetical protein
MSSSFDVRQFRVSVTKSQQRLMKITEAKRGVKRWFRQVFLLSLILAEYIPAALYPSGK